MRKTPNSVNTRGKGEEGGMKGDGGRKEGEREGERGKEGVREKGSVVDSIETLI